MLRSEQASNEAILACGLSHRFYLPERNDENTPLVILVHGRAGDEKVMWLFSKALEQLKPIVLSPQAETKDPLGGYSWWLINQEVKSVQPESKYTTLEQLQPAVQSLKKFIEQAREFYNCKNRKLIGVGFSQGAAVLSALSLAQAELFSGVALLSSFVPTIALENAQHQQTKYFIAHGRQDDTVDFAYAERSRDALQSLGAEVEFHASEVGHKVSSSGIKALGQWVFEVQSDEK